MSGPGPGLGTGLYSKAWLIVAPKALPYKLRLSDFVKGPGGGPKPMKEVQRNSLPVRHRGVPV